MLTSPPDWGWAMLYNPDLHDSIYGRKENKKEFFFLNNKNKRRRVSYSEWTETWFKIKPNPEDMISNFPAFSLFLQYLLSTSRQQKNLLVVDCLPPMVLISHHPLVQVSFISAKLTSEFLEARMAQAHSNVGPMLRCGERFTGHGCSCLEQNQAQERWDSTWNCVRFLMPCR